MSCRIKLLPNKCLRISQLVYCLCNFIDVWGEYKINILLAFYHGRLTRGHAWVTRNNKTIILKKEGIEMGDLQLVGEDKKYRYYVENGNMHRYNNAIRKK